MQAHLIEQLRDIHLPIAPGDDTVQLVLLLFVLGLCLVAMLYSVWHAIKPDYPAWQKQALNTLSIAREHNIQQSGRNAALPTAAIALRQAVSHLSDETWVTRATGSDYLHRLDVLFGVTFFQQGAGRVFGEQLYREEHSEQTVGQAIDGLYQLLRERRQ